MDIAKQHKFIEENADEILAYLRQVGNVDMVAEKFGISREAIQALLKRRGIVHKRDYSKARRRTPSKKKWEEWEGRGEEFDKIFLETLSASEVARRIGCTIYIAKTVLKRRGHDLSHGAWQTVAAKKQSPVIVKEYDKSGNISKISRETGLCRPTVRKVLESENVDLPRVERSEKGYWWEPENKKRVISTYYEFKNADRAAQKLGCGKTTLLRILHAESLHIYTENQGFQTEYECDETFFDVIDNPIKAYWFGFIIADGHIDRKLVTTLKPGDVSHLELFKKDIGYTGPIYTQSRDGCKSLTIDRIQLVKALQALGLTHRKTYDLEWKHLAGYVRENSELMRHVVRGYTDGDGCVYESKGRWGLDFTCHKESFLRHLDLFLAQEFKFAPHCIQKGSTAYHLRYSDRVAFKIAEYLYKDASRYLQRKYDKYLEMQKYFASKPEPKAKISEALGDLIKLRFKETNNLHIVGEEFGYTPSNIRIFLNKQGVDTSRKKGKTRTEGMCGKGRCQQRKAEIIALYKETDNVDEVARRTGLGKTGIRGVLHAAGVATPFIPSARKERAISFDLDEVRKMNKQGLTREQIAKKLDCSETHVYRLLNKAKKG